MNIPKDHIGANSPSIGTPPNGSPPIGATRIIGVDEAGRGPLAGPVVAAALLLCKDAPEGLDDSKKLSAKRRGILDVQLRENCIWAVGVAEPEEIDRINILQATMLAMTRAVAQIDLYLAGDEERVVGRDGARDMGRGLGRGLERDVKRGLGRALGRALGPEDAILIDGNMHPADRCDEWDAGKWGVGRAIVGGDALEPAISGASIIAKEWRDRIMVEQARLHPQYGWERNKGYGSREHMQALRVHGPSPLHRRSFAPVAQAELFNQ